MISPDKIERAEAIVGHEFKDPTLLERALTHPSAVEGHALQDSYERMEFLGDSVLGYVVALELYEHYPTMNEGALTRTKISLVSGGKLSSVAHDLGLEDCIVFGESEIGTGGRGMRSALENVYESLVAALYLDGGQEACRAFVARTLHPGKAPSAAWRPLSPKSRLQEITQARMHCAPTYELISQEGPAHAPTFTAEVSVAGRTMGRGSGTTKKEAETKAATVALKELASESSRQGTKRP